MFTRPVRPLVARDRGEEHRAATPLELFFDLCFVAAAAQIGAELVHALAAGHVLCGVLDYWTLFFGIWWAWVNFTWFASSYDNDDVVFRVMTLVQITGVLVFAAGIGEAFGGHDLVVCVLGYAVMRLALVAQWLRVARNCGGSERRMALRYAGGIVFCQVVWQAMLLLPEGVRPWWFLVGAATELCVPAWAEQAHGTSWHPHHIAERYGLFTIIVLGETIIAATVALKGAVQAEDGLGELVPVAIGGLLVVFAAWWVYFGVPAHDRLLSNRQAFLWGYGHFLIFTSAAAIGPGIEIAVEQIEGKTELSQTVANLCFTAPAAVFFLATWALHSRYYKKGAAQQFVLPLVTAALLACTLLGHAAILAAGLVCVAGIACGITLVTRAARAEQAATS
ncbi:hypothetical protein CFP65_6960 [Kitasatospora sp. MMS16-BH015]|nr:hypothetical protein CFP65_6960 [Kitasatospora sp. MMS16-BH015]